MLWIDPSLWFSLAGQIMLVAWLLLAISLWFRPLHRGVEVLGFVALPVIIGAAYLVLMLLRLPFEDGGYGSLDQVRALFADDHLLLAGWLHFLVFDFFVGTWIARRSRGLRIWRILILPCLALCFLAGPAGLLAFLVLRAVAGLGLRAGDSSP